MFLKLLSGTTVIHYVMRCPSINLKVLICWDSVNQSCYHAICVQVTFDKVSAIEHNSVRCPSQKSGHHIVRPIFFYQYTKKILTSRAFHPCITLGVKDNRKLVEKSIWSKKIASKWHILLTTFLVTQVWAAVMAKFAIWSYLSKLPNVLLW